MKVGMKAKMRNTLMYSPKAKQNVSLDASTAVQMDILVKIALDHRSNVMNAIGPEEITRKLALNPGRSEQPRMRPLRIREKEKKLEQFGCSSCQSI